MAHQSPSSLDKRRHSLAHLLAAAIRDLYPNALPTIGPATDNGFYYDFDFGGAAVGEDALAAIESNMKKLLPSWTTFEGKKVSADEARTAFAHNKYKLELIEEIEKSGEQIMLYTSGDFTDLCRGGHMDSMADITADSFKLDRIAGAYWRGSEKNAMLTRIYGLAFESKAELEAYILQQEEAKKRDHKKLGRELGLFTFSPLVGSGLPMLKPKGALIRKAIEDFLWDLHKDRGYDRVWTPHLAKLDLYEKSGHLAHYKDDLFYVEGAQSKEKFCMKPMSCPHHMQIFADQQFSYRDMPVRYFEPATIYRDEKTGQLAGLTRVRSITQDDGHLFCRVSQIKDEVSSIVGIIREFYSAIGMLDNYWVRLSIRGEDKSQYLGSDEIWNTAEAALEQAAKDNNLNYKPGPGEAAFYGPKLDFMFKDAIGREWQLATIQCDFNMPERFDLSFINEKGEKERPVVFHRAISGSLERFLGVIIEHFAGNFPLWLSPVQVAVIPVGAAHTQIASEIAAALKSTGLRIESRLENDTLGKKIRAVKTEHIPYWIVVGDKEVESGMYAAEHRSGEKTPLQSIEGISASLLTEIRDKKIR